MSWKEFFRPTKGKLKLFIFLFFISFSGLSLAVESVVGSADVCRSFSGQGQFLVPNLSTYIFLPFVIVFYDMICNIFILLLINMPYTYVLSCIMVFIYDKLGNRKKEFLRLDWKRVLFFIIILFVSFQIFGSLTTAYWNLYHQYYGLLFSFSNFAILIFSYTLSCLIVWGWDKLRGRKK